ncbi:MAG: NosD domain-containing protein [Nanobdellota archaeon]
MIKKSLLSILFMILCFSSLGLAADCFEPKAGETIDESVTLCSGEFQLDDGMKITSDNVVVKCDDTIIEGYDNEDAFSIVARENVTIKGCEIVNFQMGITVINSDLVKILDNLIKENKIGLLFTNSNQNLVEGNTLEKSTNFGVFIKNKSKVNSFKDNRFTGSAFNIETAEKAPYNNYNSNEYVELDGPGDYTTDYVIDEEVTDENNDTNEESIKRGTQTFDEDEFFLDPEGDLSDDDLMNLVYEAKGLNSGEFIEEDIEKIEATMDKVKETAEKVKIDYDEKTTTFIREYEANEDVENLQLYEYIPKSIAENVSMMDIYTPNYTVLVDDPLIMWEYEEVKAGQKVEVSYKVNKVVKREKKPENTICLDCTKKKAGYSFIIPLLLIPVIIFGFIAFDKMQSKNQ